MSLQVDDRDKGSVEDGPDDVELPSEGLNADGSNFNHHDYTRD